MKIEWILLCDHASFSNERLNIVGIFDEVHSTTPSVTIARMYLVFKVLGKEGSYNVVLKGEHESGRKIIHDRKLEIKIPSNGRENATYRLVGVDLPKAGDYYFRLYLEGKQIAEKEFKVLKNKPKAVN